MFPNTPVQLTLDVTCLFFNFWVVGGGVRTCVPFFTQTFFRWVSISRLSLATQSTRFVLLTDWLIKKILVMSETISCILRLRLRLLDFSLKIWDWDWDFRIKSQILRLRLRLCSFGLKNWDWDWDFDALVSKVETETETALVSVSVSRLKSRSSLKSSSFLLIKKSASAAFVDRSFFRSNLLF